MVPLLIGAALVSVAIWLVLLLARGGFWRMPEGLDDRASALSAWPDVVAVVPARNAAEVIGRSIGSRPSDRHWGGAWKDRVQSSARQRQA